ncbi:MAG TPA: hypothetical protein VEI08_00970 [Candidatus Bathyarchaeia archaeon]|nr:hypothetical protein [Candidatus Bathyarchaeia archaeon]
MKRNAESQEDLNLSSSAGFEAAHTQDSALDALETRLQDIESHVQELKTSSPLPWPSSRARIFDAALDLRVKIDAVRWMLRVSKHLNGAAREQVILTIANSLAQLEKAVEPATRAA